MVLSQNSMVKGAQPIWFSTFTSVSGRLYILTVSTKVPIHPFLPRLSYNLVSHVEKLIGGGFQPLNVPKDPLGPKSQVAWASPPLEL